MAGLILIVDDEPDIVSNLEYNLQREGYLTRTALTGADAVDQAWTSPVPNLILLDLMLPDASGTDICRRLRQDPRTKSVPIIMLTAKTDEIDRVVGFEVGADDYVTKPFSVRELLLRIRAVLRRVQSEGDEASQPTSTGTLSFGMLSIDQDAHRVWVEDQEVRLTALEFRLLVTLLTRKGRVQSRSTLLSDVWGMQADVMTRTVDTHVKRLREKLLSAGRYVETLRGVGYRFSPTPDGAEP